MALFDYTGKVVLVTGAGAGIGRACALAFGERGARVCVNSVSESGKAVAEEIRTRGGESLFVQADVQNQLQVERMVQKAAAAYGKLDVLVNCAGIVTGGSVVETDLETWNRVMAVNATGVFLTCRAAMPYLRKTRGCITNITSLVAIKGIASRAAYSASKGAVLALSRAMAADCLATDIL